MTYCLSVSIVLKIYFFSNLTDDADHNTNDVNCVIYCTIILSTMGLDNPINVLRLGNQSNKSRPIKLVLPVVSDGFFGIET